MIIIVSRFFILTLNSVNKIQDSLLFSFKVDNYLILFSFIIRINSGVG
jgi:hypothetical protein